MEEIEYIEIPGEEFVGLRVPKEIKSFSEENADWLFIIYLLAISALDLEQEEEHLVLEEESLGKVYDWLVAYLFPHLDERHRHEISFGLGHYATVEGIVDLTPSDMFADELEEDYYTADNVSQSFGI